MSGASYKSIGKTNDVYGRINVDLQQYAGSCGIVLSFTCSRNQRGYHLEVASRTLPYDVNQVDGSE